jgi:hypothetical protein
MSQHKVLVTTTLTCYYGEAAVSVHTVVLDFESPQSAIEAVERIKAQNLPNRNVWQNAIYLGR